MNNNKYQRKTMNKSKMNYQQTKIYRIESHLGNKIYIGSTTKKMLCQRMTAHREDFKRWKAGNYHSISSFLLLKIPNETGNSKFTIFSGTIGSYIK